MSIRMQLVLTNHFEYSAIILNFRGEEGCHQHSSHKIYSINQYFNHICTQVWILCSSFECVFKMFLAETLHVFNVFLSETLAKYANVQGNVMTFTTKTLSTSETDWGGRGTMTPALRSQRTAPSGRGTPGFHQGCPQNR